MSSESPWVTTFLNARKRELAEKLLNGTVTKKDKEEIYYHLTGVQPLKAKRGRRSRTGPDVKLAWDYLWRDRNIKRLDLFRDELARKYGVKVDNAGKVRENTFYIAVSRGVKQLEQWLRARVESYEKGEPYGMKSWDAEDARESYQFAIRFLTLIDQYKARTSIKSQ